jgi:hypothetical protein
VVQHGGLQNLYSPVRIRSSPPASQLIEPRRKRVHGASPISFGTIHANVSLPVLATWECLIGLGLVFGKFLRATLALLALQMLGTFLPLVLVGVAIVVGATVRGGRIDPEPGPRETLPIA